MVAWRGSSLPALRCVRTVGRRHFAAVTVEFAAAAVRIAAIFIAVFEGILVKRPARRIRYLCERRCVSTRELSAGAHPCAYARAAGLPAAPSV